MKETRPIGYTSICVLVEVATESPFLVQNPIPIEVGWPHKILPLSMSRKVREPVGMRVIHIRRSHRRIALVPIRSISLLRVVDFFAGVETVTMAVVGKD